MTCYHHSLLYGCVFSLVITKLLRGSKKCILETILLSSREDNIFCHTAIILKIKFCKKKPYLKFGISCEYSDSMRGYLCYISTVYRKWNTSCKLDNLAKEIFDLFILLCFSLFKLFNLMRSNYIRLTFASLLDFFNLKNLPLNICIIYHFNNLTWLFATNFDLFINLSILLLII